MTDLPGAEQGEKSGAGDLLADVAAELFALALELDVGVETPAPAPKDAAAKPQRENASEAVRKGVFITLEGGEGAGKSTQVRRIKAQLAAAGLNAVATREPGGSPRAEILRNLLLAGTVKSLGPTAEALLFAAARIDHIDTLIAPALAAGTWVVSDRFADSTRAYQGAVGGVDPHFLNALERVTLAGLKPDLTLILDLPAEVGLARAARRRGGSAATDRFESEDLSFHAALRAAFLAIAAAEPERCIVVDASHSEDEVAQAIWDAITHRLIDQSSGRAAHGAHHGA
jgi:dTMP kinase